MRPLDYSRKNFARNPLFRRSIIQRKPSFMRKLAVAILVLIAMGAAFWAVFLSGFFAVRDIQVTGNERVPAWEIIDDVKERISGRIWYVLPKDNILLLDEDELSKALVERFVLAEAEIVKKPPARIDIAIVERVSSILLTLSDGTRAVLSLDGSVLRVYSPDEPYEPAPGEKVHNLIDDKDMPSDLKDKILSATIIQAVIAAPEAVRSSMAGIEAASLHIEGKSSRTLRIVTTEGWGIYVDAYEDLAAQLKNADLVLHTKIGADRSRLDYIDARFGEKVFFKLLSAT